MPTLPTSRDEGGHRKANRVGVRSGDPASGIGYRASAGARTAGERGKSGAKKSCNSRQARNMSSAESRLAHRSRHAHRRREGHQKHKSDSERRRRHRTKEAESDRDHEYVYPRERRKVAKATRPRYEEVRVLGRHGDEDEEDAGEAEDRRNNARDERHRSSRPSGSHHHRHHRDEAERPRVHRTHLPRSEEEERERDERRRDRRAARESEHARGLPHSSRARREHHEERYTTIWSKLFGNRSKSVPPPPSPRRPRTKRNFSDPVLSTPRPEFRVPECDDIPRQPPPEKHKSERRKEKHTSIIGGIFAPTVKEQIPVKLVTCVVCMDDDIKSTRAPKLKCGHRMCHSCLRRSFKLSTKDPQQMPPKCCTADAIPFRVVDKLFSNEWKGKWNRKFEEYTTKDRIYCPSRRCGEWIRPEGIKKVEGKKQGVCGKCKTRACGTCNAKWHGVKECPKDPDTNALLDAAREAGWKRCYSCKMLVERKEGCNHMTCRCTAEFCMLCGLRWRTCECPWFNYETVEADRLAHMRVPVDVNNNNHNLFNNRRTGPPQPPLFPPPNPLHAFFPAPPPRPAQPQPLAPAMPNPLIDAFGQMMNHQPFGPNLPAQEEQAQQQQAAARQRQREQHRQLLRRQQQLEERQRQLLADEELAREMARANLITTEEEAPRQRRRTQGSVTSSEAPRSVQAGLGGLGRRRGSDRVDGWMEFVEPEVWTVPVR